MNEQKAAVYNAYQNHQSGIHNPQWPVSQPYTVLTV